MLLVVSLPGLLSEVGLGSLHLDVFGRETSWDDAFYLLEGTTHCSLYPFDLSD